MSALGDYILDLYCDHRGEDRQSLCEIHQGIKCPTRMEALAVAREAGWLLSRSGKCYCSQHAEEHRK